MENTMASIMVVTMASIMEMMRKKSWRLKKPRINLIDRHFKQSAKNGVANYEWQK
jgi:hypothetical protein